MFLRRKKTVRALLLASQSPNRCSQCGEATAEPEDVIDVTHGIRWTVKHCTTCGYRSVVSTGLAIPEPRRPTDR